MAMWVADAAVDCCSLIATDVGGGVGGKSAREGLTFLVPSREVASAVVIGLSVSAAPPDGADADAAAEGIAATAYEWRSPPPRLSCFQWLSVIGTCTALPLLELIKGPPICNSC